MTDSLDSSRSSLVGAAVAFEASLAVLGFAVAWAGGVALGPLVWPQPHLLDALAWGVIATLVLLPVFVGLMRCPWRPLARLRHLVGTFVRKLFGRAPIWQLVLVSLAAGVGEEILFRGAIQPIGIRYTSPLMGVAITSLLFGLVHAVSWTYFWLATLIGVYFGALAFWRGEILSAMIAHALYDLVALVCISRGYFARHRSPAGSGEALPASFEER